MDDTVRSKEVVPENMRKQLGVAVRSVQWSYAIFWSLSASEQGTLEWVDGYYNGDVKTRKRVPAKADEIGLERSEQLRELYKSLLGGEIDQQNRRPSAALSPEDLSDAEWYYLVCMSFVFKADEGLPGKALANKQTVWLYNAQYADSKVFTRSLLAKSASIKTVVCFPHLNGVIELGSTELVSEDQSLIQHIKASLLDFSKPVCSEKFLTAPHNAEDDDHDDPKNWKDHRVNVLGSKNPCITKGGLEFQEEGFEVSRENIDEECNMDPSDDVSNGCKHSQQHGDSFVLEGVDGEDSQVQDWDLMADKVSHGVQDSINYSNNSISDAFLNPEKALSSAQRKSTTHLQLDDLQHDNQNALSLLNPEADDYFHYRRTVSAILKCSNQLTENACFGTDCRSSFVNWKKGEIACCWPMLQQNQNLLKKILFDVPVMHFGSSGWPHSENERKDSLMILESCEMNKGLNLSDQQRENAELLFLSSMLPSICETDKVSILTDTIKYLKELEARIEELESCMGLLDYEESPKRNNMYSVDQTSYNYKNKKIDNVEKHLINKKTNDIDEVSRDSSCACSDDQGSTFEGC